MSDTAYLECDRGICLYREKRTTPERCIKHGALLLCYVSELTGLPEHEARKRWKAIRQARDKRYEKNDW